MKALTPARSHPDRQVSPLTPPCRPDIPSSTTWLSHGRFVSRLSAVGCSRLRHPRAGSPRAFRRNRFVILRTVGSPPVALHPASRRRSYLRLLGCDQPGHGLAPCRQSVLTDALAPVSDWLRMRQAIVRPLTSMLPVFMKRPLVAQYAGQTGKSARLAATLDLFRSVATKLAC